MENKNNFCIFIISNGRPNEIYTLKTLEKAGCTIPTYIVIDNLDKSKRKYVKKYKKQVQVFHKPKYAAMVDQFDNFNNLRTTTHARNACFDIAKDMGFKYFLVLDDDYTAFYFRINGSMQHPRNGVGYIVKKNIDTIFLDTLKYYKNSNFTSICYSQGGDWFGGKRFFNQAPKRKAMNSFFCSVDRRFWFISRLNEDVNTYVSLGKTDNVFMTIPFIQIGQKATQKTKGGMSEAYINDGTYTKSFYTVMCRPDSTKINLMGRTDLRMHHLINWNATVPKIIRETNKK